MKLCAKCQRELFDCDEKCDICGNNIFISSNEISNIKNELISANSLQRNSLLKIEKYNIVNQYLLKIHGDKYWKTSKTYSYQPIQVDNTKPTITCPYCKSTDTKKISGLSKAGSVALFGVFALGKTTKQWHCNNCNSDF